MVKQKSGVGLDRGLDRGLDEGLDQYQAIDIVGGTQLLIFPGNGYGSFKQTPIRTITYSDHTNEYNGYGTFETPIAVLDLNGDGLTDLVESGPNGVSITYGRPDGVFDTAQAIELTQVMGYEAVADFNEHGIPYIAATGDQAIKLSLGKGDGTIEYRKALPRGDADFSTPLSATYARIEHGDFNGDHHQDIIAISSSSIYQYDDYIRFMAPVRFQLPPSSPTVRNRIPRPIGRR